MRAPRRTQARTEIRMQYRPLGRSDLRVSHIGLGTMTWGEQNDEAQAHEQLDAALAAGVNFVDTAEMYPRSEEHTSELQSQMRISYAVFCLNTKKKYTKIMRVNSQHQ